MATVPLISFLKSRKDIAEETFKQSVSAEWNSVNSIDNKNEKYNLYYKW